MSKIPDRYEPKAIESKWQRVWAENRLYEVDLGNAKTPFYNLMMFPYPSAEGLHVGNMYAFCGSDIYGRYKRMKGASVFEPIGLDGFGIHSENYALKVGRHPMEQAKVSQENFYRQLHQIGNGFDWSRKLETYDPDYYKWTQWIFTALFKAGLAYRQKAPVNFCPSCKTVLADEQVIDGKCERCGTEVERKNLEQWFFRITKYADRLLNNLEKLDWSERVKIAQKQWIGKSEGIEIKFQIPNSKFQIKGKYITVFTKFPETIFGVTYMVLAPEHPLVNELVTKEHEKEVSEYIKKSQKKSEMERMSLEREKTGVFIDSYCVNPVNRKKVPIWVADYVIGGYGTGAVMGVPGSDIRDFEFAKKFGLEIIRVIGKNPKDHSEVETASDVLEEGWIVNSDKFGGLATPEPAKEKFMDYLRAKGWGERKINYHLRDWLISRQRYWGSPIPMIFCKRCEQAGKSWFTTEKTRKARNSAYEMPGWYPVPEKDLPVELPRVNDWKPKGTGKSPLASVESFVRTKCPGCGGEARRETDASDTFLDSAWYFLRYTSTEFKNKAWDEKRVKKWLPVDMYIGGAEHSVLHLLYTRFLTMFFKDQGLVDFEEPFAKFRAHGLLIAKGAKMSKSKGNIVNPDDYIAKYGADTLRCYLMFCGRFSQGGDFRDSGIEGMARFLKRIWRLVGKWDSRRVGEKQPTILQSHDPNNLHLMHKTIKKVTEDIESLDYNTAIAAIMEWVNVLETRVHSSQFTVHSKSMNHEPITQNEIENLLLLLAPFAPHMTEELWQRVNGQWTMDKGQFNGKKFSTFNSQFSIHSHPWPKYDPKLAESTTIVLVVQVNGKLRDKIITERGISEKKAQELALASAKVTKYLGKSPKKVIFVKDRLINFVV